MTDTQGHSMGPPLLSPLVVVFIAALASGCLDPGELPTDRLASPCTAVPLWFATFPVKVSPDAPVPPSGNETAVYRDPGLVAFQDALRFTVRIPGAPSYYRVLNVTLEAGCGDGNVVRATIVGVFSDFIVNEDAVTIEIMERLAPGHYDLETNSSIHSEFHLPLDEPHSENPPIWESHRLGFEIVAPTTLSHLFHSSIPSSGAYGPNKVQPKVYVDEWRMKSERGLHFDLVAKYDSHSLAVRGLNRTTDGNGTFLVAARIGYSHADSDDDGSPLYRIRVDTTEPLEAGHYRLRVLFYCEPLRGCASDGFEVSIEFDVSAAP